MFKKRLKGLLAMVLAGSIAATALPLTASATIDGTISVLDDELSAIATIDPSEITSSGFSSGDLSVNPDYLNANNMWAVNAYNDSSSSSVNVTVSGDKLAEKLYEYKVSPETYSYTDIKYSHKYVVTTDDPTTTDTDTNNAPTARTFPVNVSSPSPLKSITEYTVWYGVRSGSIVYSSAVVQADHREIEPADSILIPMSAFGGLYTSSAGHNEWDRFNNGVTLIQVDTAYKTFEIPVYDGLGVDTTKKVEITQTDSDDSLTYKGETEELNGKYVLLYDGVTYYYDGHYIKTKADLWGAIGYVVGDKSEFDVSKAKLVRYVRYDAVIGYFTSVDLLNGVADNPDINYINERKNSGSIWKISCSVMGPAGYDIYPKKFVYGDSFDAEIKEFLNEYACDTVSLRNKTELHITATDPSTQANPSGGFKLEITEDVKQYITINTDKQYPVKVSDLAAKLTAKISPTAGMKYNKDEWELWPCYTSTGLITMESKATVADPAADIGIPHYELAQKQYRNDLLVYFKQVAIAPAVTVTAPAAGATPAATATVPENDGYSVKSVSWYDGETKLTTSDTFAGGKQYTVKVTLKPDTGLQFIDDTKVTINGNAVSKTLNQDGTLTASYTFPKTAKSELTGIKVTPPTKTKYKVGESIDVTGGKVTLIYDNNTGDNIKTKEIPLTADMLTYDNSKAGKATVTVKYDKFEDTFEVEFEKSTTNPTNPTKPTNPTNPINPTNPTNPTKPTDNKKGWDEVKDKIKKAHDGDTITVDMEDTTKLPKDIVSDIAGKDINLVLDMGNGFVWTINGKTVTDPKDVDMGVSMDSSIPVKVINALTGECSYITITLAHNGEFGFTAILTVDMGEKNKGLFANLYYYNDDTEKTEFICSDKIGSNGKADLTFTHASEYVIVLDDHDHGKTADGSATTSDTNSDTNSDSSKNPSTGVMVGVGALIVPAAVLMISRKKKK